MSVSTSRGCSPSNGRWSSCRTRLESVAGSVRSQTTNASARASRTAGSRTTPPGAARTTSWILAKSVEHDLRLQVTVGGLTALLPELAHRLSGLLGNGDVDIDEGHAGARRDDRADGRLSCSHEAHEDDRRHLRNAKGTSGQPVCQVRCNVRRVCFVQAVLGDEAGQEAGVDPPRHVVPGRNRQQGPGVVVESHQVGEPGGLHDLVVEPPHALWAVVEPPRGPEPQGRVVAGHGCQLTPIGRLVQGVDDDSQAGLVAEPVEQRLERGDEVGRLGHVCADVASEAGGEERVVIAPGTDVQLQDQPVVHAHGGHFGQHLGAEQLGVSGLSVASSGRG